MTRLAALAAESPAACAVLAIVVHVVHTAFGIPVEGLEQILLTGAAGGNQR